MQEQEIHEDGSGLLGRAAPDKPKTSQLTYCTVAKNYPLQRHPPAMLEKGFEARTLPKGVSKSHTSKLKSGTAPMTGTRVEASECSEGKHHWTNDPRS